MPGAGRRERSTFAEIVEARHAEPASSETRPVTSPIAEGQWWCDRTGTTFVRRGNVALRLKRLRTLLAQPECVVVHHRSGDVAYLDDLSDREALLVRARPYLFKGGGPECFTHFAVAEFSNGTGRRAVVFEESC